MNKFIGCASVLDIPCIGDNRSFLHKKNLTALKYFALLVVGLGGGPPGPHWKRR